MQRNVIGKEIPSTCFTYDKTLDKFIAEVSDFNGTVSEDGVPAPFGRLYNDACDCGFVMVSAKTGRRVVFALVETDRDEEEGEVRGWRFKPVAPRGISSQVVIIND